VSGLQTPEETGANENVAARPQRPPLDLSNLNEILFAEDLACIFGITAKQAGTNLASGLYGPRVLVGKQYAILRDVMLEHLAARSEQPERAGESAGAPYRSADRLLAHHRDREAPGRRGRQNS